MRASPPGPGVPDALRRRLGPTDAVLIGLGSMISVGIFAALLWRRASAAVGPAAEAPTTTTRAGRLMGR
ncbi:hypothetical protein SAMN05421505_12645 [Sinosporangium album]|uniref:Uncharacterized protein n=1 Tax=Sinosporangium album TaxID=504805 RepID=A0A1G8GAN8_9ACTN|nr:hypothetical protein [Sinosporangium album]SDH91447.1 hypothetical protein SAMN05421505_12645 [Sinosporangium album]